MKMWLIVVLVLLLLVITGLIMLYYSGTSSREQILAQITEGSDILVLKHVSAKEWGNTYSAFVLFFNNKQVDFRGILNKSPSDGNKFFPLESLARELTTDIVNNDSAEVCRTMEKNFKEEIPEKNSEEPDGHFLPWTVWVNPKDFSREEYGRMVTLLRRYSRSLSEQQEQFIQELPQTKREKNSWPVFIIWRTVYHDYSSLPSEIFTRKSESSEESITIKHHGAAEYYQKSPPYPSGFRCILGQLNEAADTLYVSKAWKHYDVSFPAEFFSEFRDEHNRRLTEKYRMIFPEE